MNKRPKHKTRHRRVKSLTNLLHKPFQNANEKQTYRRNGYVWRGISNKKKKGVYREMKFYLDFEWWNRLLCTEGSVCCIIRHGKICVLFSQWNDQKLTKPIFSCVLSVENLYFIEGNISFVHFLLILPISKQVLTSHWFLTWNEDIQYC